MIHDFGEADGRPYFVMEYVAGQNLRQRLRGGAPGLGDILHIEDQICDALQYAHDQGIVHRDIKPENILLDKKGRVRLADFGIAKLLDRQTGDHTLTGPWQVMGTLHYMAPEQLDNPLAVDHRADIYSLGVILYEMLTGELPLGRFALPSQKLPLDARLDEVLLRALARDPDQRYQHIDDFRMALGAIARPAPLRPAESDTSLLLPNTEAPRRPIAVLLLAALAVILWPVGLVLAFPAALWLWLVLRQPDGKVVLRRQITLAEAAIRTAFNRYLTPLFCTTTGWAVLLCVLGAAVTFQPFFPMVQLQVRSAAGPSVPIAQIFGYECMSVYAGVIYLVLFMILVATSFIEPIPLWRPLLLLLAGTSVILIMTYAMASNRPGSLTARNDTGEYWFLVWGDTLTIRYTLPRGEFIVKGKSTLMALPRGQGTPLELTTVAAGYAAYALITIASGLLLLGTVQLRGVLMRRGGSTRRS
jgi:hypothetical protein